MFPPEMKTGKFKKRIKCTSENPLQDRTLSGLDNSCGFNNPQSYANMHRNQIEMLRAEQLSHCGHGRQATREAGDRRRTGLGCAADQLLPY